MTVATVGMLHHSWMVVFFSPLVWVPEALTAFLREGQEMAALLCSVLNLKPSPGACRPGGTGHEGGQGKGQTGADDLFGGKRRQTSRRK